MSSPFLSSPAVSDETCPYSVGMGLERTSTVKDAFSQVFGDRRGLTWQEQEQREAEVASPFSRLKDVAWRRMALLDWWLGKGAFATDEEASMISPYSRLDPQVARALFEHDARDLKGMGLCREAGKDSECQFAVVLFSNWPRKYRGALLDWRLNGRPLVERDGTPIGV